MFWNGKLGSVLERFKSDFHFFENLALSKYSIYKFHALPNEMMIER